MRRNGLLLAVLPAFTMASLVLGGLLAPAAQLRGGIPAPAEGTTAGGTLTVAEEALVPLARRSPGHEGVKARMDWHVMGGWVIAVDVNPTLPARRSYKVVLKVKYQGEWVRCGMLRTRNVMVEEYVPEYAWFTRGRRPHEAAIFADLYGPTDTAVKCPGEPRPAYKYRIVLPAQHGFERTISRVYMYGK